MSQSDRAIKKLATQLARLDREVKSWRGAQADFTSIEAGTMDINDSDGNLVSRVGFQEDGSGAVRFFDGPTPPVPAGVTATADGPIIQATWDGTFEDNAEATYDLAYLEVAATLVDDDTNVSFATITAKEGASASVVADVTGDWVVAVRSVSQAGKKSEFATAGTVEVKVTDLSGAIEDVQDSANGKNKVTYSDRPPTPADPGIFDDTWFVGQVGRPNDVIEATNLALNGSFESDSPILEGATLTGGVANLSFDSSWSSTGSRSLKITPTNHWSTADINLPVGGILKPGKTYTIAGDFHLEEPQSGNINPDWSRRIRVRDFGADVGGDEYTQPSPNEAGTFRHVLTFAVASGATSISIRLGNGNSVTPAWWDDVIICEGAFSSLDYYDGDTEDGETNNESHYRWTGTPHASASEKYLPALNIGDSDNWNIIEQYRHDGTGWVKVELSHHVFSTVDLGKATVGELDGIRIMGQSIRGEQLSGDAIDGKVITGGTYRTTDGTGQWSDAGLFIAKPDGTSMVRFPTDGSSLSLTASDTQIERASVGDIDVSNGAVRSGGQLTLASGVTAPPSPPELSTGWQFEAKLPRPDEPSMDWTGLAVWNGLYVRGVNVLGSAGDSADRIELYNPDGTVNRSISIDLNPRAGVAVIGDIVYTIGPDHVAANAGKQWCHGFNLNTGARVSRWEFTRFTATGQKQFTIGTDGTNLLTAGVTPTPRLYVMKYDPATGEQIGGAPNPPSTGGDMIDAGWNISGRDLYGVHQAGSDLYITHKGSTRVYTVSGYTITRKAGNSNGTQWAGWRNPNSNAGGMTFVDGAPLVADSGAVYQGSVSASDYTREMCYTWWDGTHETTASPVATIDVGARETVTISLPVRAGLQKRLYSRAAGSSGNWSRSVVPADVTVSPAPVGIAVFTPPTNNSFPNAAPAVLKSTNDKFEVKGDGSGHWGPLTFNADGSMSGLPKMAHGTVVLTPPDDNTTVTAAVTFPTGMFSQPPSVVISADTTVPGTNVLGVSTTNITTTSFDAVLRRTNAVASRVYWIAMGV